SHHQSEPGEPEGSREGTGPSPTEVSPRPDRGPPLCVAKEDIQGARLWARTVACRGLGGPGVPVGGFAGLAGAVVAGAGDAQAAAALLHLGFGQVLFQPL